MLRAQQRQHRGARQAPADGRAQRRGINRSVQQDDLAGVPGHGLVLERQDAQILAGQRPGPRIQSSFIRPFPRTQHRRRTPYADHRSALNTLST